MSTPLHHLRCHFNLRLGQSDICFDFLLSIVSFTPSIVYFFFLLVVMASFPVQPRSPLRIRWIVVGLLILILILVGLLLLLRIVSIGGGHRDAAVGLRHYHLCAGHIGSRRGHVDNLGGPRRRRRRIVAATPTGNHINFDIWTTMVMARRIATWIFIVPHSWLTSQIINQPTEPTSPPSNALNTGKSVAQHVSLETNWNCEAPSIRVCGNYSSG